jgi:hypothetical protein
LVADPRCRRIVSIDTRPLLQTDDRGDEAALSGEQVETFERGTDELPVSELPTRPRFCFIDAENTRAAAPRDARFCLEATTPDGVIAFHDSNVAHLGLRNRARRAAPAGIAVRLRGVRPDGLTGGVEPNGSGRLVKCPMEL